MYGMVVLSGTNGMYGMVGCSQYLDNYYWK